VTKSLSERIVITGIGMVTPAGPDRESTWRNLCEGHTFTRRLNPVDFAFTGEEVERFESVLQLAGAPAQLTAPSAGDRDDRVVQLARRAAEEALIDARLTLPLKCPERAAAVVGTSKGGLRTFTRAWKERIGNRPPERFWWNQFVPDAAARSIAERYDLRGAALCPVAACATGLVSISRGAALISQGRCDVVLAGSSDASLHPALLPSFRRLGVLAQTGDDPARACRPFDRTRSGFLVGEGAAILVLERASTALSRSVAPYAELLSAEMAADPAHLTRLDPDPASLVRLIREVLGRAEIAPDEIDYVGLHGTATRQNDLCETRALHQGLGPAARAVSCSSLKGAIGHLLGAAGSVESAVTLLAMRDDLVPPTANLRDPDPECDLDFTPIKGRRRTLETALKLSLGFGGHLAAAIFRKWTEGPTRAALHWSPTEISPRDTWGEASSPSRTEAKR